MRSSKSRSRSKANRPRPLGNIVNRVFDSSGPEGKVRGTPQQIIDKYLVLARDAQLSNDRVAAENFLQHAEHYTRMLNEAQREMAREAEARRQSQGGTHRPDERDPRRDEGRGQEVRRDNGRSEHGRHDGGRPEHGRPDHGRSDPGRSDTGRHETGRYDTGRHEGDSTDADPRPAGGPKPQEPSVEPAALGEQDTGSALVETPEGGEAGAQSAPKPRRGRSPRKASVQEGADAPAGATGDAPSADGAPADPAAKPTPRRRTPRRPRNAAPEDMPAEAKSSVGE
ncbi:MAG: DUF4167 domain-containing protein [Alkalilacustris sp.]